jgi:hypothetical protein
MTPIRKRATAKKTVVKEPEPTRAEVKAFEPARLPGRPRTRFRHDEDACIVVRGKHGYVEQAGQIFSYAEFNKLSRKWEPEPRLVDKLVVWELANQDKVDALKTEIAEKQAELDALLAEKPDGE